MDRGRNSHLVQGFLFVGVCILIGIGLYVVSTRPEAALTNAQATSAVTNQTSPTSADQIADGIDNSAPPVDEAGVDTPAEAATDVPPTTNVIEVPTRSVKDIPDEFAALGIRANMDYADAKAILISNGFNPEADSRIRAHRSVPPNVKITRKLNHARGRGRGIATPSS